MATESFLRMKRHPRKGFAEFVLSAYKYGNMNTALWTTSVWITGNWTNKNTVMYVGMLFGGNVKRNECHPAEKWKENAAIEELQEKLKKKIPIHKKSQTYPYIHKYTRTCTSVRTHAHTHTYTHTHSTPTNTCVQLHILSLKWSTCQPNVEKHQIFKLLHFGIPVFWDVMLHRWLHTSWSSFGTSRTSPPANVASHPVTPLYKIPNPLVFHLHLTIIEYIRIGKQVAQCDAAFVVASNYRMHKRMHIGLL